MSTTSPLASTFGELLRQLRRRAGLTQGELAARVSYSVTQISRLEQNERLPTVATVAEVFVPALELGGEPHLAHRLITLAALARGERPPDALHVTRTIDTTVDEQAVELPGRLPALLVGLVGRARAVEAVGQRLLAAPGRLLTLIGPPGVGKTQLSLAVAAQMRVHCRDGVWFVALAAVDEAELVAPAIAASLEIGLEGGKPPAQRLVEHLRRREVLLVLDNVEQVTDCAPLLVTLLQECAGLRILATSTEPLRLRAEQRYKVQPLEPAAGAELFIQRAQAVDPDFVVTPANAGTITEICMRLDGLPLAIELIAARVDLLAPAAMLARLREQRLDLLAHGPRDLETHHRTLRTAIQRSYALLTADEQALFRGLSVYVDGCDLAAVAAQGFAEVGLRALVSKSMLQRAACGVTGQRFRLLETLRDFAGEMLAATGEGPAAQRRHADHYRELAREAGAHWHHAEHQQWLDRLEVEHGNLRAALRWLIEHDAEAALEMGAALREFWYVRGHYGEARRLLNEALRASPAPGAARGRALLAAARLAHAQDEHGVGLRLIDESIPMLRQAGDLAAWAEALRTGGWLAHSAGQSRRALAMFGEALTLSETLGADALTADLYISIAQIHALDGDEANFDMARGYFAAGLRMARRLDRPASVAYGLHGQASLEFMAGAYGRAAELAGEALVIFRELDFRRSVPLALLLMGEAALLAGDLAAARASAEAALARYEELAIPWGSAAGQQLLGQIERRGGQPAAAAVWLTRSLALSWKLGDVKLTATALAALGGVALACCEGERAALLLAAAERVCEDLPRFLAPGYRDDYAALAVAVRAGLGDDAFMAAWAAGRALPLAQAVELGLEGQ